jgi:hypothetical protein
LVAGEQIFYGFGAEIFEIDGGSRAALGVHFTFAVALKASCAIVLAVTVVAGTAAS